MSEYISTNVRCADCDNYQDEWCRKIIDSPDPNRPRDCKYYKRAEGLARVIRCKDCKHYVIHTLFGHRQGWCERLCDEYDKSLARGTEEDDFCSRAEERRTDG